MRRSPRRRARRLSWEPTAAATARWAASVAAHGQVPKAATAAMAQARQAVGAEVAVAPVMASSAGMTVVSLAGCAEVQTVLAAGLVAVARVR